MHREAISSFFFFFNDTATTEIYTLSLHDALPISFLAQGATQCGACTPGVVMTALWIGAHPELLETHTIRELRSEEHTSELQLRPHLVCRLLLEKKKEVRRYRRLDSSHRIHTGRER